MKKVYLILLVGIFALPALHSCKKGENDPALSFRSRKARLVGEWKLKEGIENVTISSGQTEVISYDGVVKVYEKTGFPTETTAYSCKLEIRKDGTYKTTIVDDVDLRITEGIWYFGTKSKNLDVKNKETVCFVAQKYSVSYNGGTPVIVEMTGTHALGYPTVWQVDRLANSELVILTDFTYTTSSGTATSIGTMTYEKD